MLCYKDKCFCVPHDCENKKCFRRLTTTVAFEAKKVGLPVSVADFSEKCEYRIPKSEEKCDEN